jgi:hypothetical protein
MIFTTSIPKTGQEERSRRCRLHAEERKEAAPFHAKLPRVKDKSTKRPTS